MHLRTFRSQESLVINARTGAFIEVFFLKTAWPDNHLTDDRCRDSRHESRALEGQWWLAAPQ
jgi:hypothetical protein